tara:strand:+ start:868 stop:1026 length:159 start_codon:yes stop_codon:yes gene_type:complete
MATRANVARTDNSKLGREVLNNRLSRNKVEVAEAPVAPVKKKSAKKSTKKSL